jgi:hypothetical protein
MESVIDRLDVFLSPGDGYGYGDGYGDGRGDGRGDGYGYGLEVYDGRKVHTVDGVPTLIYKFHLEDDANGWAVGRIIRADMSLEKTYIAKRDYMFAHGATLQEAIDAVNTKLLAEKSMGERLDAFVAAYPLVDTFVSGHELFWWHNILTGSCLQGRKAFVADRALDLDAEFTILEFMALTKNVFGGSVIEELEERYRSLRGAK